jgi:hypothetical protein
MPVAPDYYYYKRQLSKSYLDSLVVVYLFEVGFSKTNGMFFCIPCSNGTWCCHPAF